MTHLQNKQNDEILNRFFFGPRIEVVFFSPQENFVVFGDAAFLAGKGGAFQQQKHPKKLLL